MKSLWNFLLALGLCICRVRWLDALSRLMTNLLYRVMLNFSTGISCKGLRRMCIVAILDISLRSLQLSRFTCLAFSIFFIIYTTNDPRCTLSTPNNVHATIQWAAINPNHRSPVEKEIAFTREKLANGRRNSCSLCKTKQSN